jgi:hypothetical protein
MYFLIILSCVYFLCFPFMLYYVNKAYKRHGKNVQYFLKSRFYGRYRMIAICQSVLGMQIIKTLLIDNQFFETALIPVWSIAMVISLSIMVLFVYTIRFIYILRIKKRCKT